MLKGTDSMLVDDAKTDIVRLPTITLSLKKVLYNIKFAVFPHPIAAL